MAPGIIHAFEVIDIQEDHGKLFLAQQGAAKTVLHSDIHLMMVCEPGEGIEASLKLKLAIELSQIVRQPGGAPVRID